MENDNKNSDPDYLLVIGKLINVIIILLVVIVVLIVINITGLPKLEKEKEIILPEKHSAKEVSTVWSAPDSAEIKNEPNADLISYGRNLIVNTSYYFGPDGKLHHSTNGLTCQNCHLSAGTKPFGNNFSAVGSTYPKFRERSGTIETIEKRVNDCFERSLNGKALDVSGKEMQAIVCYIKWVGKNVPKGERPEGAGIQDVAYLERAADPAKGKIVYEAKCKSCHMKNGEGQLSEDNSGYKYPPLWGEHSYNIGAGLYRLSRLAGYVKSNMPQGADFAKPQLSDEESWDVSAFINSQPRPNKDISKDWPSLSGKPIDHPFGPFDDTFSEEQHKFGPFTPIAEVRKKRN